MASLFKSAPGRERLLFGIVSILPLAALTVLLRRFLFEGSFFADTDALLQFHPYLYALATRQRVIQGMLSGFPATVTVAGVWFNPLLRAALHFLSAPAAYVSVTFADLILAYLCAILYLRAILKNPYAVILGAATFLFSGY